MRLPVLSARRRSAAVRGGDDGAPLRRCGADATLALRGAGETVRIARNCRRIILQNFYGTLIVDAIGIGLAAVGLLNPLLAAFIHVASELTFIANSTRLLPPKQRPKVADALIAVSEG